MKLLPKKYAVALKLGVDVGELSIQVPPQVISDRSMQSVGR